MFDVIVIGAGPAGLTAALYVRRADKTVLILEKNGFGGQMTYSPKIENYPGYSEISGNELADKMVEQVLEQGAEVEIEEVLEIKKTAECFKVITDCGEHSCKTVISALGAKHRLLGVPGEEKFIGEGISFCAVCDGAFYADKNVAVIGGGNSALQEAILLSNVCKSVFIIQNLPVFTGEECLVKAIESKPNVSYITDAVVKEFYGKDEFEGAVVEKKGEEPVKMEFDGVFVAIGLKPENDIVKELAQIDNFGYVNSGESCTTKTDRLFVAGDCRTKKIRQITTATADGAIAALAAIDYLDKQSCDIIK